MPRTKKMKHFNHPHELFLIEVRREHLNSTCFACKQALSGSCYACSKCSNFFFHKSCGEVPQSLQHKAHSKHTLGLLFPPLCNGNCNACGEACNSFAYNCTLCNFNLHVDCASKLENEKQDDYEQEGLKEIKEKVDLLANRMQMQRQEEEKRLIQEMEMAFHRRRMNMYQQSIDRMGRIG